MVRLNQTAEKYWRHSRKDGEAEGRGGRGRGETEVKKREEKAGMMGWEDDRGEEDETLGGKGRACRQP